MFRSPGAADHFLFSLSLFLIPERRTNCRTYSSPPLHPQHILFQTSHNRDIKNKKEQNNRSNKKEKKIKLGQQKSHPLIAIFLPTYLPLRWIIIFHTSHPLYCFNANMHIFISPPPLPTSSYLLIINLRPFLLAFASTYQLLMLTTCA